MQDHTNMMSVTIHAANLDSDESGTPQWALLLQTVAHTIEQFEARGWHTREVFQDTAAATITFQRRERAWAEISPI